MRNLYQTTIGGGTTTPLHHFQPPIHPPSTYNTTSHQSATTAPTTVGPHVHFVDNQSTTSSNGHINPSYHAPGLLIGPVAQLNHHFNHQQFGSSPTSRSSVKSILKLTEDGMTRSNSTGQHKLSSSSSISSNSSSSSSSTYQNHHSDFYAACGSAAAHSIANHHRIQSTPSTVSSASSTSSSSSSNVSPSPLSIGLASSSSPASSPSHSPQSIMPMSKPDHLERRLQQSHEAAAAAEERQQSNERFFESNTLYKKELKQKQRDILSSSSVTPPTHQQSRLYPIVNNNSNVGQKTASLINHLNSSVASSNNINNQQINQLQHPPPVNVLQQRAHMLQMRTKPFTSSPMELRQSELNRASEKRSTLPTHMHPTTTSTSSTTSSGSNKVLNLFTNFLSRTKSNIDDQQSTTTTNISQPTNYLNLKNLKRASSSTHFAAATAPTTTTTTNSTTNKSKSSSSSQSSSHESSSSSSSCTSPSTSTSPTNRSLSIFNPSNLFVAKSSASNNNKRASIDTYRRSYDDVSRLNDHESVGGVGEEHDTSIINRFDENTAYSTKNNGLIFLPNNNDTNNETLFCNENILVTSAANYENLNLGPTNSCTSPIVVESLSKSNGAIPRTSSTFCANLHQIEEDQIQKPSDEKNAIEKKTTSTKQSPNRGKEIESEGSKKEQENGELVKQGGETSNNYNAFDNVVYSYVDNLREHSKKRLSEINLLKQSAAAAAATAAAKAVEANSQESGSDQLITDTLNLDNTNQQSFSVKPANSNSMSSSSSSSASISPKSLCSSTDTVIINKTAPTPTTTATPSNHVLSLRDKFESQSTPTKPKTPSMTKKLLTSSAGLVVSTTSNNHNLLSSPVSVSLASSSSSSSSTSSASSSSSSSFIPPTIPSTPKTTTHINDSSSSSDSSLLIEIKNANTICNKTDLSQVSSSSSLQQTAIIKPVDFNFYNEFYKPSNESRKSAFYTSYESLLRTIKETSSSYIRSILDPIITIYPSTSSDQSNELLFKFTVDFYQPILAAQNKYKLNGVSSSKLMDDNELSINTIDQALYIDEEAMNNETGSDTCLSNIFEFLTLKDSELTTISDEFRTRANHLLNFKLNFLNSELILITNSIESNEKLGQMILSELEKKATSIELEKYKLLVNESDVITNLLIKLCNKLANTENLMSLMQMKQNQSNEEIDLLKQELNQTQRKKEEAIFLKNGIDKRANLVSKFLLNYFDSEQLENYETFMKMKLINALKMRHVKDNTDLTKLQIKLLNSF